MLEYVLFIPKRKTINNKNCYCLCCDANYGWIKHYLNDHFRFLMCPCKKQKPQGLISHLYHRGFKIKTPCPFDTTAYYYLFYLYDGQKDVNRSKNPPAIKKETGII